MMMHEATHFKVDAVLFPQGKAFYYSFKAPFYIIPAYHSSSFEQQKYQEDIKTFLEKWFDLPISTIDYN